MFSEEPKKQVLPILKKKLTYFFVCQPVKIWGGLIILAFFNPEKTLSVETV